MGKARIGAHDLVIGPKPAMRLRRYAKAARAIIFALLKCKFEDNKTMKKNYLASQ